MLTPLNFPTTSTNQWSTLLQSMKWAEMWTRKEPLTLLEQWWLQFCPALSNKDQTHQWTKSTSAHLSTVALTISPDRSAEILSEIVLNSRGRLRIVMDQRRDLDLRKTLPSWSILVWTRAHHTLEREWFAPKTNLHQTSIAIASPSDSIHSITLIIILSFINIKVI